MRQTGANASAHPLRRQQLSPMHVRRAPCALRHPRATACRRERASVVEAPSSRRALLHSASEGWVQPKQPMRLLQTVQCSMSRRHLHRGGATRQSRTTLRLVRATWHSFADQAKAPGHSTCCHARQHRATRRCAPRHPTQDETTCRLHRTVADTRRRFRRDRREPRRECVPPRVRDDRVARCMPLHEGARAVQAFLHLMSTHSRRQETRIVDSLLSRRR